MQFHYIEAVNEDKALFNAGYGCPVELNHYISFLMRMSGATPKEPRELIDGDVYTEAILSCVSARSFDRSLYGLTTVTRMLATMIHVFMTGIDVAGRTYKAIVHVATEETLSHAEAGRLNDVFKLLKFLSQITGAKRSSPVRLHLGNEIVSTLSAKTTNPEIRSKLIDTLVGAFMDDEFLLLTPALVRAIMAV
jgi:hypothetical protein